MITESKWKEADLAWLLQSKHFVPSMLPKFKTHSDVSQGLYDSNDDYFNVVLKLWVALTFGEGFEAIQPGCRSRDGDRECGRTLVFNSSSGSSHCFSKDCFNPVTFTCVSQFHDYSLCSSCHRKKQDDLRGPPSNNSSTHLYDANCVSFRHDGTLFLDLVQSRKPPPSDRPIHWRTTKRLASPNLVAIVKVPFRGASLDTTAKIFWGTFYF